MKTIIFAATASLVPMLCMQATAQSAKSQGSSGASNGNSGASVAIPTVPLGILSANPTVVQTGTHPTLTWNIIYPSSVEDVATILPPGTISVDDDMYVSVRPVGVGPTKCTTNQDVDQIFAEARISINGSDFQQLFYGTDADVDPGTALYIKRLRKGTKIDFGGRYVVGNAWTPFYTTRSANFQVVVLVDGDEVPTTFDLNSSGKIASYLRPYINGSGKVSLGPLSMLVVMELAETDHASTCFDYQDFVLMVNFATNHPNNGHGNNLDGVDSSNPGKGSGGPNGQIDPSGGVDDEIR